MFRDASSGREPAERLWQAMNQGAELSLIVKRGERWLTFHSHLLAVGDGEFSLLQPKAFDPSVNFEFKIGAQLGVSFRLEGERYALESQVTALAKADSGTSGRALTLTARIPDSITVISNRLYQRVDVPATRNVSCFFWPGGCEIEPSDDSPAIPSWIGSVRDRSVGGCRIVAHRDAMGLIAKGDIVGMIIQTDDPSLFKLDAHLARVEAGPGETMFYAMRFSLMQQTLQTRLALDSLRELVRQLAA
jgi:hypothetical protein